MSHRDDEDRKQKGDSQRKKEAAETFQRPDPGKLSPEEYLERFGVSAYLKDAMTVMLENRPENPLEFMSDYFRNALQSAPAIVRCYRYIRLTGRTRPAFRDNIIQAYTTVSSRETGGAPGLVWPEYMKLLKMVCSEFPDEVTKVILSARSKKDDSECVSFNEFSAGIEACLIFEEFVEQTQYLFRKMDSRNTGVVPLELVVALTKEMISEDAHCRTTTPTSLNEKISSVAPGSTQVSWNEFLLILVKVFVQTDAAK